MKEIKGSKTLHEVTIEDKKYKIPVDETNIEFLYDLNITHVGYAYQSMELFPTAGKIVNDSFFRTIFSIPSEKLRGRKPHRYSHGFILLQLSASDGPLVVRLDFQNDASVCLDYCEMKDDWKQQLGGEKKEIIFDDKNWIKMDEKVVFKKVFDIHPLEYQISFSNCKHYCETVLKYLIYTIPRHIVDLF